MRIITISREFGSGGRELGRNIAKVLGYDYYDKEIITAIAKKDKLDENYVSDMLENHGWENIPITRFHSLTTISPDVAIHTSLFVEQSNIIKEIGASGKDCVIIGRNADVLLEQYKPFNIFVCADIDFKIERCMEYAMENETMTRKALMKKIKEVDKNRTLTRGLVTSIPWGDKASYHVTLNTMLLA